MFDASSHSNPSGRFRFGRLPLIALFLAASCPVFGDSKPVRLTPPASPAPVIRGPKIFGVRPGSPFLFTVAATGNRPMAYSADGLPAGLHIDGTTGQIAGAIATPGDFHVVLRASNALGSAERDFRIVCGNTIALTPPMGWNSWNCFGADVTDPDIRDAADAMVASGLANYGWTYINIDDGWAGKRDANGVIQSNEKFPDMKALCDYVHSKGLKIGIYSSPGAKTCAGFAGSLHHEQADAQRYAEWGVDYIKYDLCSYQALMSSKQDPKQNMEPYSVMEKSLSAQKRDIVYSLCQYGWGNVWQWGTQVGAQSWRTTGDIWDGWRNGKNVWEHGVADIGFNQNGLEKYAGPGHWNDPDMLVVGVVGWGKPRPTRLVPDEQYTLVSLWSMLAAPLLIGSDMSKLDDFTLGLLTNAEVIAIDQDPLGRQGFCAVKKGDCQIWTKPLEDGSVAVGLFNLGGAPCAITAAWNELGLHGPQVVRDVWRNKDIGVRDQEYGTSVASHGVCLLRVIPSGGSVTSNR